VAGFDDRLAGYQIDVITPSDIVQPGAPLGDNETESVER
jgi:hypothetical protein